MGAGRVCLGCGPKPSVVHISLAEELVHSAHLGVGQHTVDGAGLFGIPLLGVELEVVASPWARNEERGFSRAVIFFGSLTVETETPKSSLTLARK